MPATGRRAAAERFPRPWAESLRAAPAGGDIVDTGGCEPGTAPRSRCCRERRYDALPLISSVAAVRRACGAHPLTTTNAYAWQAFDAELANKNVQKLGNRVQERIDLKSIHC